MDKLFEWLLGAVKFSSHSSKVFRKINRLLIAKHVLIVRFFARLHVRVEKSSYFRRDGADVHTDAEISLAQALLGGTIRVQGVYETQTIQVHIVE